MGIRVFRGFRVIAMCALAREAGRREQLPEGKFWDEIKPIYGRWVWPFAQMAEGDWFIVDQLLKPKGPLANLAHVRGYKLNKRFSVVEADKPGFTMVECKGETKSADHVYDLTSYGQMLKFISRFYGIDGTQLQWTGQPIGWKDEIMALRLDEPKQVEHVVQITAARVFTSGLKLEPDRIVFEVLPDGMTRSTWLAQSKIDLLG